MLEFRIGDLAKTIGVHRNTVRNWIKNGVLRAQPIFGKKYSIEEELFKSFLMNSGLNTSLINDYVEAYKTSKLHLSINGQHRLNHKPKKPIIKNEVPMTTQPLGSITVVGGGIAGIQAALDLADSGYYVYLIEKSPGIGGGMSKLDKTFPTNDCAM